MKQVFIGTVASLSLLSSVGFAKGNDCSFNFDHDLSVMNNAITISQSETETVMIDSYNQLYINNQMQTLTPEQQRLVDSYADNIRILIPEITSIAIEGIALGVDAASLALGTLLGQGDPDYLEFVQRIEDIGDRIVAKLDAEQFDSRELERTFEEDFEKEIEAFVEQTINELTPRLMAKVMTAALAEGAGASDIERRAQNLEADIEAMVEPRAELLEQRAEELCSIVQTLDSIETELVNSGLTAMDLIKADGNGSINLKNLDKYRKEKSFNLDFGDD